jgi:hypothetical protein
MEVSQLPQKEVDEVCKVIGIRNLLENGGPEKEDSRSKIFILLGMSEIIFYRSNRQEKLERQPDFKEGNGSKIYLRPGFDEFLRRITDHPRCHLIIYSAMMSKNLVPVLDFVFSEQHGLDHLRASLHVYDQKFCPLFKNCQALKHLENYEYNGWDFYRDLDLIVSDEYAIEVGLNYSNSLLINEDHRII